MSLYSKWAQKEHSFATRIAALIPAAGLFLVLLPYVIAILGPSVDRKVNLPAVQFGALNYLLGGLLMITGFFFAFWSIAAQLTRGRGTPLPVLPTQELLTQGPFAWCRNPMTFGTIAAYLGLAILAGTLTGIGIVLALGALLILYLKRMEERELAERFGAAYLHYKQAVPFIVPRLPKR